MPLRDEHTILAEIRQIEKQLAVLKADARKIKKAMKRQKGTDAKCRTSLVR